MEQAAEAKRLEEQLLMSQTELEETKIAFASVRAGNTTLESALSAAQTSVESMTSEADEQMAALQREIEEMTAVTETITKKSGT